MINPAQAFVTAQIKMQDSSPVLADAAFFAELFWEISDCEVTDRALCDVERFEPAGPPGYIPPDNREDVSWLPDTLYTDFDVVGKS